ncbi:MAG: plasmid recombination protein, partial [Ruminococcus sp.]|nr:plasmid recombination protein [Candidatus Copronaster equi]
MPEQNFSFVRIKEHTAKTVGNSERHNERKNENYSNDDVDLERSSMNIHFKDPGGKSYIEILHEMEEAGKASERGLRDDATLFDEMIFDVNTRYFDNHGGYEYAKEFFSHCYDFAREKYGEEYIVSAVMHADELNKGLSEDRGEKIYHYHLHVVAIPVVEKEIRWSKRYKDEALRGTVKEVIHQISHSKKWPSLTPETDDNG